MSYAAAKPVDTATGKPGFEEQTAAPMHKIRITLTSRNVKNLEKGKCDLMCNAIGSDF